MNQMKTNYIFLFIIFGLSLSGCRAHEVTANLSNVNVNDGDFFVSVVITNLSKEEFFIDKMYLSSDKGVLVHDILEVIELIDGQEKTVHYRGMFRDYSEFHDYKKTAVSILPGKNIRREINISSHYPLSDDGVYKVRYGGIVKSKKGESVNVITDYVNVLTGNKK